MGKRLYVGNLSYSVTDNDLRDAFTDGGYEVVDVKIVMDRDAGRPRGFAFVELATDEEATRAIEQMNGRDLQGRSLNISEARERTGGGGGGGGRGGGGYGGGGGGGRGGYGGGGGGRGGGGGGGRRERW
ncbi:MAG TPA: RNA-binding protein [Thermoanaerobaculia bacterium]|nr:RNA-binding protein [Thermoanaerobaculia bacterium]